MTMWNTEKKLKRKEEEEEVAEGTSFKAGSH